MSEVPAASSWAQGCASSGLKGAAVERVLLGIRHATWDLPHPHAATGEVPWGQQMGQ